MSSTGQLKDGMGTATARTFESHRKWSVGAECHFHPLVEEISPAPNTAEAFERFAKLPRLLFLDSAQHSRSLGRYSFLAADPFEWIVSRGRHTFVSGETEPRNDVDPFAVLEERWRGWRTAKG